MCCLVVRVAVPAGALVALVGMKKCWMWGTPASPAWGDEAALAMPPLGLAGSGCFIFPKYSIRKCRANGSTECFTSRLMSLRAYTYRLICAQMYVIPDTHTHSMGLQALALFEKNAPPACRDEVGLATPTTLRPRQLVMSGLSHLACFCS